jgi:hypothetical protein
MLYEASRYTLLAPARCNQLMPRAALEWCGAAREVAGLLQPAIQLRRQSLQVAANRLHEQPRPPHEVARISGRPGCTSAVTADAWPARTARNSGVTPAWLRRWSTAPTSSSNLTTVSSVRGWCQNGQSWRARRPPALAASSPPPHAPRLPPRAATSASTSALTNVLAASTMPLGCRPVQRPHARASTASMSASSSTRASPPPHAC